MISDSSKLALVAVAATFGVLVGLRVANNMESTLKSNLHIDAILREQRLLREEEKANQLNSESDTGIAHVGPEPPKWQLVIEKVGVCGSYPAVVTSLVFSAEVGILATVTSQPSCVILQANSIHFIHIRNAFRTLGWVEKNDTRFAYTQHTWLSVQSLSVTWPNMHPGIAIVTAAQTFFRCDPVMTIF